MKAAQIRKDIIAETPLGRHPEMLRHLKAFERAILKESRESAISYRYDSAQLITDLINVLQRNACMRPFRFDVICESGACWYKDIVVIYLNAQDAENSFTKELILKNVQKYVLDPAYENHPDTAKCSMSTSQYLNGVVFKVQEDD